MKIYLASSWKNEEIVKQVYSALKQEGYEVDCFCKEEIGRFIFSFAEVPQQSELNCKTMLERPIVQKAFKEDKKWIEWCDVCIMLLPCGNSTHLEGGYAKGSNKKLIIYGHNGFADLITESIIELINYLRELK